MGSVDQFSDCAEAVHPSIVHPSCQAEPSSSSVARTRLISPMMTRHDGSRRWMIGMWKGPEGKGPREASPGKCCDQNVRFSSCVVPGATALGGPTKRIGSAWLFLLGPLFGLFSPGPGGHTAASAAPARCQWCALCVVLFLCSFSLSISRSVILRFLSVMPC